MDDYQGLKAAMIAAYQSMPNSYWHEHHIQALLDKFPEGQVVLKVNDEFAGCALAIIVDGDTIETHHTYAQITGNYTFDTHNPNGDTLYGIDIFVTPGFRGLRLGRRLYDYRKELCEKLNLKGIAFGGRIPNYYKYAKELSPKDYIEKVRLKEIHDPVLNFQLSNDFHPVKLLKGYLEGDKASSEYAVLLEWDNIYFEKPSEMARTIKTVVRLGLIQWQMRPYKDEKELIQQAEYFIDALSGYRSDFALFPEFFNAPLMAKFNHLNEPDAIRKLAGYTDKLVEEFAKLSVSYNINIITGSVPEIVDNKLYNVGYLCQRNGSVQRYEKLHVTPDEAKIWGMGGGTDLRAFDTDCGRIGILICYDIEFPELSRILANDGIDILFVPFLTDTQNGYSRVKHCAQARAIENECYVAIAGSVGNLPKVHNMDIQFAQSMVFTPCDFAFPNNGIKAEATPNTEMILIADVDLGLLRELHNFGSVRNLKDRRLDLFELKRNKMNKLNIPAAINLKILLLAWVLFVLCPALHGQTKNSREDYINLYKGVAVIEMERTGIPASITMAQGILESGNGNSTLARKANNHFGIKCHSTWTGQKVYHDDDKKNECFRKYNAAEESYQDHSDFLVSTPRYKFLFELDVLDYKAWAKGLKKAGYATARDYDHMLIKIIEEHQLFYLDKQSTTLEMKLSGFQQPSGSSGVKLNNNVKYVIMQPGESILSVAKRHDKFRKELIKYNDLSNGLELRAGDTVYLQPKRNKAARGKETHVASGQETLNEISQQYAVKLKKLVRYNHAAPTDVPEKGTEVYLRGRRPFNMPVLNSTNEKPGGPAKEKPIDNQEKSSDESEFEFKFNDN
ncbi:MAG: GNAT family N-acetyltransferase [Bacteroidales bacterium]|nr:GNAT family N-acetyltransferase [Bacteroidales bacterium]